MICRIILSLFYEFFLLRHEEKGQDIMKSLQQKLGEALPYEEQTAYEQTARETKRIFRNRFLIWLGITTGAAVLLSVLLRLTAHISPVITAAIVFLIGFIVLWCILPKTEETCRYLCPASPQPTPQQMQADQAFSTEIKKLKDERIALAVGSVLVFPLIGFFLLLAGIRAYAIKSRPGTAISAVSYYASNLARKARAFTFFFLPSLLLTLYIAAGWKGHSTELLKKRITMAHDIYSAAAAYQNELEEAGQHPEWETVIVAPGQAAEEGSLQFGIRKYVPQLLTEKFWYAVVLEDGQIEEVYCRYREITPEDLTPPDFEEQMELAISPSHAAEAFGYYRVPAGSARGY